MSFPSPTWSVAIIGSREDLATLEESICSAIKACTGHSACIDVLINGNPDLAHKAAARAPSWDTSSCCIRVWSIAQGDKAHAWNEYVHRIWTPGTTAFFLDAYARARADAFVHLDQALQRDGMLGATGVPTSGRSAPHLRAQMLREGGFHGNMHVISATSMARLKASGFRLPLGLYRTDSLIGAVLMFDLDPAERGWEPKRIAVAADATWDIPGIEALTLRNIMGQLKRIVRQARGHVENRAAREHLAVRQLPPEQMPRTSDELMLNWVATQPQQARSLFIRKPLSFYAVRKLHPSRDWSLADVLPSCLVTIGNEFQQAS